MTQPFVIVGSGASAAHINLASLRGLATIIVINQSWRLAPGADVLYGCDRAFWLGAARPERTAFAGRRLRMADDQPIDGVETVEVVGQTGVLLTDGRLADGGGPGWGGNSGFQALNLAVQMGARHIIGAGLDFKGRHWHPDANDDQDTLAQAARLARWAATFDAAAPQLAQLGVRYFDTSPGGALTAYPKMSLPLAMAQAALEQIHGA